MTEDLAIGPADWQQALLHDSEHELLASCLISRDAFHRAQATGLQALHLAREDSRRVWDAFESVDDPADVHAVVAHLRTAGMGPQESARTLSLLMDRAGTSAYVEQYAERVVVAWRDRTERAALNALRDDLDKSVPAQHAWERYQQTLETCAPTEDSFRTHVNAWLDELEAGTAKRTPSGSSLLDEALGGGLGPGWLVVVMAPPGSGKTAWALGNASRASLEAGERVAFVSLEMQPRELVARLVSGETAIPLPCLTKQRLDAMPKRWSEVQGAVETLCQWDLAIATHTVTADAVCAWARQQHRRKPLSLLCVDYLQLIANGNPNRAEDLSATTRAMKRLAGELQIPVMLLSQPTLESRRKGGAPRASDAKGSGSIEEDADLVLVPYRPAPEDEPWRAELRVRKCRHGEPKHLTEDEVEFEGARVRFKEKA